MLYVGHYIPLHGVPVILEAARKLRHERVLFTLIGAGQARSRRRVVRRVLTVSTTCGSYPPFRIRISPSTLDRADVVLGIFDDGVKARAVIPKKAYLALASTRCLVTGDTPGAREWLRSGENALLVPPADPGALAEALVSLRDASRMAMRMAANGTSPPPRPIHAGTHCCAIPRICPHGGRRKRMRRRRPSGKPDPRKVARLVEVERIHVAYERRARRSLDVRYQSLRPAAILERQQMERGLVRALAHEGIESLSDLRILDVGQRRGTSPASTPCARGARLQPLRRGPADGPSPRGENAMSLPGSRRRRRSSSSLCGGDLRPHAAMHDAEQRARRHCPTRSGERHGAGDSTRRVHRVVRHADDTSRQPGCAAGRRERGEALPSARHGEQSSRHAEPDSGPSGGARLLAACRDPRRGAMALRSSHHRHPTSRPGHRAERRRAPGSQGRMIGRRSITARDGAIASLWALGSVVGARGLTFAAGIVLARLLSPRDFGVVGMALIVTSTLSLFQDLGFGKALLRDGGDEEPAASTVFTVVMALAAGLSALVLIDAGGIANLFGGGAELARVLRVAAPIPLLTAIALVPATLLERRLDFRRRAWTEWGPAAAFALGGRRCRPRRGRRTRTCRGSRAFAGSGSRPRHAPRRISPPPDIQPRDGGIAVPLRTLGHAGGAGCLRVPEPGSHVDRPTPGERRPRRVPPRLRSCQHAGHHHHRRSRTRGLLRFFAARARGSRGSHCVPADPCALGVGPRTAGRPHRLGWTSTASRGLRLGLGRRGAAAPDPRRLRILPGTRGTERGRIPCSPPERSLPAREHRPALVAVLLPHPSAEFRGGGGDRLHRGHGDRWNARACNVLPLRRREPVRGLAHHGPGARSRGARRARRSSWPERSVWIARFSAQSVPPAARFSLYGLCFLRSHDRSDLVALRLLAEPLRKAA